MTQWAEIRHQHQVDGIPKKELARRFNIDVKTVRRALQQATPPKRRRAERPSRMDRFRALISEQERSGLSVREFADVHGITPTTLYWWRSKLKRRQPDPVPVAVVADDPLQSGHVDGFELRIDAALTLRMLRNFASHR